SFVAAESQRFALTRRVVPSPRRAGGQTWRRPGRLAGTTAFAGAGAPRPVRLAGTSAVAATVATLLGAIGSGRLAPADRARAASHRRATVVTVGAPLHLRPLASGFMGLSLEYRAIEEYGGHDPGRINPLLVRLVRDLSPGEHPELRIGG